MFNQGIQPHTSFSGSSLEDTAFSPSNPLDKLNGLIDRTMMGISIVAKAFNSKPGSSNWNPIAV